MAVTKRLLTIFNEPNTSFAGYKVYTYTTGTSSLKTTYKDAEGAASHANPIVLDSNGLPPTTASVWLSTDSAYRIVVNDADDVAVPGMDYAFVNGTIDPSVTTYVSKGIKFANGEGILDTNGNEILTVQAATNAVNQFNMVNSATGDEVLAEAAGADTHIDLHMKAKGSQGDVHITARGNKVAWPTSAPTAGQIFIASTATQASWGASTGYFAGNKTGMITSNAADADHDITITAGSRRDSSDTVTIIKSSAMTKQIDAGWTAGTNQGGLASGVALAADTWYHLYAIYESDDGTVDYGWDTSLTATALLADSGYDKYAYIWSYLTDASANIIAFYQVDNVNLWKSPTLSINTTTLSTTRTAFTVAVPTGIRVLLTAQCSMTNASACSVYVSGGDATAVAPSLTAAPLANLKCENGTTVQGMITTLSDSSRQIYAESTAASTTLRVAVTHYINLSA